MIRLGRALLGRIEDHALTVWPDEACGLLVGTKLGDGVEILEIEPTRNVAPDRARRFEIDPARHIAVQRALRGSGRAVVGVYHSHPGGSAEPSASDQEEALDPDLVWLIVALKDRKIQSTGAFRLVDGGASFAKVDLVIGERA